MSISGRYGTLEATMALDRATRRGSARGGGGKLGERGASSGHGESFLIFFRVPSPQVLEMLMDKEDLGEELAQGALQVRSSLPSCAQRDTTRDVATPTAELARRPGQAVGAARQPLRRLMGAPAAGAGTPGERGAAADGGLPDTAARQGAPPPVPAHYPAGERGIEHHRMAVRTYLIWELLRPRWGAQGETSAEIAGLARAMRAVAIPVHTPYDGEPACPRMRSSGCAFPLGRQAGGAFIIGRKCMFHAC